MTPVFRAADFLQAFLKLLPRGRVWPRDTDAVQNRALLGLNTVYENNSARALSLLKDAFPASTYELLPEWEATLGLPDPCVGPSPTVQQRVSQVVARLTGTGGQSIGYYRSVATTLGYDITIQQFVPSRCGQSLGKPLGGLDWAFAWQVTAPAFTVHKFRLGASTVGEPLAYWNNNVLTCELSAIAPAHTILNFQFSE